MYAIFCLVFLFYFPLFEADPQKCSRNEHRGCIYQCSPKRTCKTRDAEFNCLYGTNCKWKCVCRPGLYRNSIGECVSEERCERCPGFHEYFACGSACDNECSTLHERNQTHCPILTKKCTNQCYCEEGYARNSYGECILIERCP